LIRASTGGHPLVNSKPRQAARRGGAYLQDLLATTLEAFTTAGWFAGELCQRWQLEELAETARSLAGELVIDAIFAERSDLKSVELRLELRTGGLLLAVHSGASYLAVTPVDHDGEAGPGLEMVQELAQHRGMRRQTDGSRVVWCILGVPDDNLDVPSALRIGGCFLRARPDRRVTVACGARPEKAVELER
jgi:hypothetical protein